MTVELNHRVDGSGPHVLLLHAVGMDLTLLEALTALLKKDFTILRADMRGHGKTAYAPATSLAHYADDVHGFFTMDLILDNAQPAYDAVAEIAADLLELDAEDRDPSFRASRRTDLRQRLRRQEVQARYLVERIVHQHVRAQRAMIRILGLPAGRDVVALNSQLKRLENQVRQLRRQLDQVASESLSAPASTDSSN